MKSHKGWDGGGWGKRYLASILIITFLVLSVLLAGCSDRETLSPAENPPPPAAHFTADPVIGEAPLSVRFTDCSTGDITSWNWDFGDGQASILGNPSHTYTSVDNYTVTLKVEGPGGADFEAKADYVKISIPAEDEGDEENEKYVVSWENAGDYIGEHRTVEGTVVTTYYAETSKGKPTFLDFHDPYEGYFKGLIWGNDRAKFVEEFPPDPETHFKDKRVQIRGFIESYKGTPEIILQDPSQIEVIEPQTNDE